MANSNWTWKDAAIGGLWAITMILASLGFNSIKENLSDLKKCQAEQASIMTTHVAEESKWRVQYERDRSTVWRVIDRICGHQSERLRKEGKVPDYFPANPNHGEAP